MNDIQPEMVIDFSGLFATLDALKNVLNEGEVRQALLDGAFIGEAGAKEELQKMVYDIPETPGYKRTRNLFNSTQTFGKVDEEDGGETLVTGVKSSVHYAPYVQFGTKRGMRPRPYLSKGVIGKKQDINEVVADGVAKAVARIAKENGGNE